MRYGISSLAFPFFSCILIMCYGIEWYIVFHFNVSVAVAMDYSRTSI